MEAAYAVQESNPLKLYNCLVPMFRDRMFDCGIFCDDCMKHLKEKDLASFPMTTNELRMSSKLW